MAEDESHEFSFDQPWNPISYFEEESEAIGSESCQYSPSRLASLFETNISAVDEDIARSKNITHNATSDALFDSFNETADVDELDNFTLETESGIKVLDTTLEINRKAIFSDFDRLKRWQQSIDKTNVDQNIDGDDMFINEPSDFQFKANPDESNKKDTSTVDDNIDFLLESLPNLSDSVNQAVSMNEAIDKLTEIENRLNDPGFNFTEEPTSQVPQSESEVNNDENMCVNATSDLFLSEQLLQINTQSPEDRIDCSKDSILDDLLDLPSIPNHDLESSFVQSANEQQLVSLLDIPNEDMDKKLTENVVDQNDNTQPENTHLNKDNNSNNGENVNIGDSSIVEKASAEIDTNLSDVPPAYEHAIQNTVITDDDVDMDEYINSDDANEVDALVAIATNIIVTPPTPVTDDIVTDEPKFLTSQVEVEKDVNLDSLTDACQIKNLEQLVEPPGSSCEDFEDTSNITSNAEILDGVNYSKSESEKADGIAGDMDILVSDKHTDTLKNTSSTIANEEEMLEESIEKEQSHVENTATTADVEVDVKKHEQENSVVNVRVSSVQQNEPIQCLTPDDDEGEEDDDSSETNDVETYMISQRLDRLEMEEDTSKLGDGCSPLPDVNFELQKAQIQENQPENDTTDETSAGDSLKTTLASARDRDAGSAEMKDDVAVATVAPDEAEESPVCFVADTSIAEDDLDNLLDSLEIENSSNIENTKTLSDDANVESIPEELVQVHSETDTPSEHTVVVAALAATAVPETSENIVSTNNTDNATENTDINNAIDPTLADTELNESTQEENRNANLAIDVGLQNLEDNPSDTLTENDTPGSSDNVQQERRTSLRSGRTGSTPNSSRRVRFSLNPQYEGENNESATPPHSEDLSQVNPSDAEGQQDAGQQPELPQSVEPPADAPQQSSIPSEIQNLGWVAPTWVPDENANNCMKCGMKFTVVKRRHHCRACGKVLCSLCCNMKYCLPYLEYKSARVCQTCCDIMVSSALESHPQMDENPSIVTNLQPPTLPQHQSPISPSVPSQSQLPQAPPPYSESAEGHSERLASVSSEAPPYSERPPVAAGYAEQPAPVLPAGAHGMDILPSGRPTFSGSQLTEMMNFQLPAYTPSARQNRNRTESEMSAVIMFNSTVTNLPPILRRNNEETRIVNNPDLNTLFRQINDENEDPISFIVNKNLVVRVKVVNLDCCVEKKCWCFTSDGMGASNQEELVILVKCNSFDIDERTMTRKVLQQMNAVFEKAKHGHPVSDLEQMEFEPNMCCMPKNVGMLFFKHSLQCIKKLLIPTSPYLFGVYVEKSEMPWAKNFPLRLLLRIGAEFKYYPCPIFNVLDRAPVYEGVGRTILDLLADFRTFQYTIPRVVGVTINLRGKDTIVRLPQHRYDEIMKAVNACEENVLSLAGNFSSTCDGHLVSVEKDGRYKTQTLSIVLKANRKVTCASFIVISAALKLNQDGVKVKASIVEDGVMVQVTSDVMKEFKQAVKDMKEFSVVVGDPNSEDCSKVGIEWSSSDVMDRPRLLSPIDGTSFDNLTNMKIRHSYDYTSNNLTAKIHWVEVYFLPQDNDTVQRLSARELGQMTSSIAKACMSALSAHLMTLIALDMTRIGLRVNLAADFVEYKIGSNLATLPGELLPNLDDKLVPAIHNVMSSAQERVAVELIFQVVKIV